MKKIVTHNGSFHPDDVFAVAVLQLKFGKENIDVLRSRNEADFEDADFVVDVGHVCDPSSGKFDHHQNGAPVRENGIPYAAFGLVWKEFGVEVAGSEDVAAEVEERLAQAIDAPDNGISLFNVSEHNIEPVLLFHVLHTFKPVWGSDKNIDDSFLQAVDFSRAFLERFIAHAVANQEMTALIKTTYESDDDKTMLVFDKKINSHALIKYPEVRVIVYPSKTHEGTIWRAAAVPETYGTFTNRVVFPKEWGGLLGSELSKVSGIEDAYFCHKAGFLFGAESKEGAVTAAEKALEG